MTPTNELRWVKKEVITKKYRNFQNGEMVGELGIKDVLQQKWVKGDGLVYWEWRDVPTVEEE